MCIRDRAQAAQTSADATETQPEVVQTQEATDEVYQEPLLVGTSTTDSTTNSVPASTSPDEQPLTQTGSDVSSYSSDEQATPAPAAVADTDTTTPENTVTNGNSILSPDEVQSLVKHGNEEQEENSQE